MSKRKAKSSEIIPSVVVVVDDPVTPGRNHGVRYNGNVTETQVFFGSTTARNRTPAQIRRGEEQGRKLVDGAQIVSATSAELTALLVDIAAELKRRDGEPSKCS